MTNDLGFTACPHLRDFAQLFAKLHNQEHGRSHAVEHSRLLPNELFDSRFGLGHKRGVGYSAKDQTK
jgi:hypothetical protein